MSKKPTWDEYFMELSEVVRSRADCLSRQVGALIIKNKRIIATGYNGTPHGIKNCTEGGCLRCAERKAGKLKSGEYEESCVCIHAEQNAIIQAAYLGVSTKEAILYSTNLPCSTCAKLLINAGIKEVVYKEGFHDEMAEKLLKEAGVTVRKFVA